MAPQAPEHKPDSASDPHGMNPPESLIHEAIGLAYGHFGESNQNQSDNGQGRNIITKGLDLLQILPYGEYYAAYEVGKGINWVGDHLGMPGKIAAHILAAPLIPFEAGGLIGNELLGLGILASNHGKGNMYEGIKGGVVPHFMWANAPKMYLPGIREDGKIDFSW